MINPWKVLGVHRKSTDEEIRKAFHTLSKKYHPDRFKGSTEKFLTVSEAYAMLKDKQWRSEFLSHPLADSCSGCGGSGVKSKSKGLTEKVYSACGRCGGAGLIINSKEKEDEPIELHGTDGAGGQRRDHKRRP